MSPLRRLLAVLLAVAATASAACGGAAERCEFDADCLTGEVCDGAAATELGTCSAERADRPGIDDIDIPGGAFWMGCDPAAEPDCQVGETPAHEVTVPAFRIDRTEVSVTAFVAYLNLQGNSCYNGVCAATDSFFDPPVEEVADGYAAKTGVGDRAMNYVTWNGADNYCQWRGQRLCTEAEWELAALGACDTVTGDCAAGKRTWPWGDDEPTCDLAWMQGSDDKGCDTGAPTDVGSLAAGASPYGVLDMAGNVWEWTADWWHGDYTDAPTDGSAWLAPLSSWRVVRGGGLGSLGDHLRGSHRWNGGPDDAVEAYGFRCCR